MPQNIIECVSSFFQVALFLSSALMIELETIELIREYIYETVDETFCNFTNFEWSLFIWVLFSRIFETIFGLRLGTSTKAAEWRYFHQIIFWIWKNYFFCRNWTNLCWFGLQCKLKNAFRRFWRWATWTWNYRRGVWRSIRLWYCSTGW